MQHHIHSFPRSGVGMPTGCAESGGRGMHAKRNAERWNEVNIGLKNGSYRRFGGIVVCRWLCDGGLDYPILGPTACTISGRDNRAFNRIGLAGLNHQYRTGPNQFYEGPEEDEEGDPLVGCLWVTPFVIMMLAAVGWVYWFLLPWMTR